MKKISIVTTATVALISTASAAQAAFLGTESYTNVRVIDTDPMLAGAAMIAFAIAWIAVSFINGRHSENAYKYELAKGIAISHYDRISEKAQPQAEAKAEEKK